MKRFSKEETINPRNTHRWKQVCKWYKDEVGNWFLSRTSNVITINGYLEGFKYFVNGFLNTVTNEMMKYVFSNSINSYGKISILKVCYKIFFGYYVKPEYERKAHRISKEKEKEVYKKTVSTKKEIKVNGREAYIEFVFVGYEFQKRVRDKKTGRFVKIPKKYK